MDGFGDNFDQPEVDPAAEFLAREQDQLAGLEDELNPTPVPAANGDTPLQTDHTGSFEMIDGFGQQDGFDQMGMGGEFQPPVSAPVKNVIREEPEKIKKWREEQKERLEQKDANEEKKREEWREVAKKELEDWYRHHEETISKTKAANRESAKNAEKLFVAETDAMEPGTEWERIAKLCDFNPKSSKSSKDVSRMRSIILQLKQSPPMVKT
ncbi:clathrin light chain isoform X5 [Ischnura elegans]|uniref:clathrin light chain isoform X5 n=1 Tax=Ischnura elegans TaxID=197161 RepID=UPI001ED8B407|nr:clathrin light chain isoform X5 [Ischnura elegans]